MFELFVKNLTIQFIFDLSRTFFNLVGTVSLDSLFGDAEELKSVLNATLQLDEKVIDAFLNATIASSIPEFVSYHNSKCQHLHRSANTIASETKFVSLISMVSFTLNGDKYQRKQPQM